MLAIIMQNLVHIVTALLGINFRGMRNDCVLLLYNSQEIPAELVGPLGLEPRTKGL